MGNLGTLFQIIVFLIVVLGPTFGAIAISALDSLFDKLSESSTIGDAMDDVDSADLIEVAPLIQERTRVLEDAAPQLDGHALEAEVAVDRVERVGPFSGRFE